MSAGDWVAFFIPLIFIGVLWNSRRHFLAHPLALGSLVLLTIVSILHFDVGMLASDPYDDLLDDLGAPRGVWAGSVIALIVLSYSGELQERLRPTAPRRRGPRQRRTEERRTTADAD